VDFWRLIQGATHLKKVEVVGLKKNFDLSTFFERKVPLILIV